MITASQVKDLREKTGAGMMDCKKVLTEADGDMEKAIELLRERGIAKAAKKSDRVAAEGLVTAYVSEDGKVGAVAEVNAETDFVAKNDEFRAFANDVAKQVAVKNPKDVEELLAQTFINDETKTVLEVLTNKIATIGENMSIRRFVRFESNGSVAKYIHGDGKIAVLVDMENASEELAIDNVDETIAVSEDVEPLAAEEETQDTSTDGDTEPTEPTEPSQPTEPTNPTDTPRLPQTGQLWWPVPILAMSGFVLLLLGWLRRKESRNET